eukprot:12919501-Prorocentrum_lima.AAC.1
MMNLGFSLDLSPDDVCLTCPSSGYNHEKIPFNQSRHLVINTLRSVQQLKQSGRTAARFAAAKE